MDTMRGFEIPSDMRRFAEQSVDQARRAFEGFINAAQQTVTDMESRGAAARTGAKDVGDLAMRFAQRNITASFDHAQQLVRARDVQEVMKLQADYIKAQIAALNEQAKELGQTATQAAMDASKPKF